MLISGFDWATSFAWYSRTLRMRRGPSTNICTLKRIWIAPSSIWVSIDCEFYRNGEQCLQIDASDKLAHIKLWRKGTEVKARDRKKASTCGTWAEKDSHIRITSSPCKVKHVWFYQHLETVPDDRSCWWAKSSQVTEVFHSNPDWKTQCEDLPKSVEHPNYWDKNLGVILKYIIAHMHARGYHLLWCLPNKLCSWNRQLKLTSYNIVESSYCHYSAGNINDQEDDNKEDKHHSRSLIHGM